MADISDKAQSASRIAVIGAGVAGLTCARHLADAGRPVVVFEKSRGLGGRMATRRREGVQFDHGAPSMDPAEAGLGDWLAEARADGTAADWEDQVVGTPGMTALCRSLARGLDIRFGTEISQIPRDGQGWQIGEETFGGLVLAIPAPQITGLQMDLDAAARATLSEVTFKPVLALMAAFDAPTGWPAFQPDPPAPFALLVRDSAKPGRPGGADCWVAHADDAWSRDNIDRDRPEIAEDLLDALARVMGPLPRLRTAMGHRWRYARPVRPLGEPFLRSACGTVWMGGDWALGDRIGHAARSGAAMAAGILADGA